MCIVYGSKWCHRAVDNGELRVAVRASRVQETGRFIHFYQSAICKTKAECGTIVTFK